MSRDFETKTPSGRFPYCVSFWVVQRDGYLRDYIREYSGATLSLYYGDKNTPSEVRTFLCRTEEIAALVNDERVVSWKAEQTKEIRFLPNAANSRRQIAFILDPSRAIGRKLTEADLFRDDFPSAKRKYFLARTYRESFLLSKQDVLFTNRENAVVYGLPSNLVEGILVGRVLENDPKALEKIHCAFPWCYIANIDGVVIQE